MQPHSDHQISLNHHALRLEGQPMNSEEFPHQQDAITNFEPSLVVVTGILAIVFALTILLLLYFKFCHSNAATSTVASGDRLDDGRPSVFLSRAANVNRPSGLDKKAIQSLPFFLFGVLKGAKEGLECSVCLSKYQDAEILRLLPKCRHAFHVDCIDQWLSHHSTCPLCRSEVAITDAESCLEEAEDSISNGNFSTSASIANDEGVELFVERENDEAPDRESAIRQSSSVFCISSSFRRVFAGEGRIPVNVRRGGGGDRVLHKHNHKIVFSDVVFKNRWSNVSSSDLRFLNSEILISSDRFSNRDLAGASIREEPEYKKRNSIEFAKRDSNVSSASPTRALLSSTGAGDSSLVEGRRSVSEITQYSRFKEVGWLNFGEEDTGNSAGGVSGGGRAEEEGEIKRKLWFPIARKTVEKFANGRREDSESKRNQHCDLNVV